MPMMSFAEGDGAGGGSWIDTLPAETQTAIAEEDRKDPAVTKYKTLPEFVKGHRNAQELLGKKGVILPTEKSTPQEVEQFWTALGRPGKAEEYKLTELKDLHPSIVRTPESQKKFFEAAHKFGFTNKQADELNRWYLSEVSAGVMAQEKAFKEDNEKASAALRTEWGKDYDQNFANAKAFVMRAGGQAALDAFGDIGSNPAVLKVLAVAGKAFAEDNFRGLGGAAGASDAQKQIDTINADRAHPYWDDNHADHAKWVGPNGLMLALFRKVEEEKKGAGA
jgi:hypothetical protein